MTDTVHAQERIAKALETLAKDEKLPDVTAADAGKVLMVDSNGKWVAASLPE